GILATAYEYTEEITEAFDFASAATLRAELVALLYFVAQHEGMLTTEVKSFLKGFATGANLSEESMALRFRAYCTAQGRNLRGKKATKVFFNAVNAVLQGRDIKLFGSVKGVKLVLEPAKPKTRKRKA